MAKKQQKKKKKGGASSPKVPRVQLPKDALQRVNLGQAFAEYDLVRTEPDAFVTTPAIQAALDPALGKSFFVGRRGTGKTAITYYLSGRQRKTIHIHPQVLSPMLFPLPPESLADTRQRPFRSLVAAFKRALLVEVLSSWQRCKLVNLSRLPPVLSREQKSIAERDFDLRLLQYVEDICRPLIDEREEEWLREIGLPKRMGIEMSTIAENSPAFECTLLIDRVEDSWDGSDTAMTMLVALMHASVELIASVPPARPLVFLRENVFDRARQIDHEFSRLDTCVVSMDWTRPLLLELIERRLMLPFTTKLALGGPAWGQFFEESEQSPSDSLVFEYCQERPRDVLTYCSFAVESAQAKRQSRIMIDDLLGARKRFSESRLKDLGDEYAENYPQIKLVLERFYGMGREFTVPGVDAFVQKLIVDDELKRHCGSWVFRYTSPELFIRLLYNIGFFGMKQGSKTVFRALGPSASAPPAINADTHVVVHPSYRDALDLRDVVTTSIDKGASWQRAGFLQELPDEIDFASYAEKLADLKARIQNLPLGPDHYVAWEEAVGDTLRLCFYRWLVNVEYQVRDVAGCTRRDWVASNRASSGFWEIIRLRYDAIQVIWECKNEEDLDASDFQQASYYMSDQAGRFVVVAFRGEVKKHYYRHISRIAQNEKGMVLLLRARDILVFVRQAINGKISENHIQEVFDRTLRETS